MAASCGECLMNDVEVVALVDGVCPRCGADYTVVLADVDRAAALAAADLHAGEN